MEVVLLLPPLVLLEVQVVAVEVMRLLQVEQEIHHQLVHPKGILGVVVLLEVLGAEEAEEQLLQVSLAHQVQEAVQEFQIQYQVAQLLMQEELEVVIMEAAVVLPVLAVQEEVDRARRILLLEVPEL